VLFLAQNLETKIHLQLHRQRVHATTFKSPSCGHFEHTLSHRNGPQHVQ